jgi:hypothetical protein
MSTFLPVNLANIQAAATLDYPAGKYLLTVDKVEVKANNDGNSQRLVVVNKIDMGPEMSMQFNGKKISNSYQLTEQGAPFLKRLILSCGITEEQIQSSAGQFDSQWLVGRQYVATVVKNGQYSNLTNERPASEWGQGQVQPNQPMMAPPAQAPALVQPIQQPMMQQAPQMPQMPQMMQPGMMAPQMPMAAPQMAPQFAAPPAPPARVG